MDRQDGVSTGRFTTTAQNNCGPLTHYRPLRPLSGHILMARDLCGPHIVVAKKTGMSSTYVGAARTDSLASAREAVPEGNGARGELGQVTRDGDNAQTI